MNNAIFSKYNGWEFILIVIISLTLLFIGVTESLYINVSIRNFFIFSFFSLGVVVLAGISGIARKTPYSLSIPSVAMLIWLVYILIHGMLTGKTEQYFFLYYTLSILLFLSSVRVFRTAKEDFKHIYSLFFILAVVEAVICILQFIGIANSHDNYFKVKGTFENPNTTAMYIVSCIPYAISTLRTKKWRIVTGISSVFMLVALVIINCRTAYLGLVTILLVYILRSIDYRKYILRNGKTKITLLVIALSIFVIMGSLYLYESKKSSADGRLFIWKVSTQMIAQRPLSGYGYGFFQKEYNLFQAEYFQTHSTTADEKLHASYVFMPYNDLLEQAIQGGIPGAVLYLTCMGLVVFYSLKSKLIPESAMIISFLTMSQVNYGIQAIPLWMLFLLGAASVTSHTEKQLINLLNPLTNKVVTLIMLLMVISIGVNLAEKREAQQKLPIAIRLFKSNRHRQAINLLDTYKIKAGTSELYFGTYAKILMETRHNEKATEAFDEALLYAAKPSYLMDKALCCKQTEKVNETIQCLQLVASMKPCNLRSRYLLMRVYADADLKHNATEMAQEITQMPVKIQSAESNYYQAQAKAYLNNNRTIQ